MNPGYWLLYLVGMSKSHESESLKKAVKHIVAKYNVDLKDFIQVFPVRFASELHAQELVEQATVNSMSVIAVDPFQLASQLVCACQPSLVRYPGKKFPRFISVLKKFQTMEELAELMEEEFKAAGMSSYISTFLNASGHKRFYLTELNL